MRPEVEEEGPADLLAPAEYKYSDFSDSNISSSAVVISKVFMQDSRNHLRAECLSRRKSTLHDVLDYIRIFL